MNDNSETVSFEAGDLTFDDWRALVDQESIRVTGGFEIECFADWDFADAYEGGVEPAIAACRALAADSMGREYLHMAGIDPDGVA